MVKRQDTSTLDLFRDFVPPEVVLGFQDAPAGGELASRISRAIARALKDCGQSREEIATLMSERLGAPVTVTMLDAYASEAKVGHQITVERFVALVHATGQKQLMGFLGSEFDLSVVPSKFEPVIQLALLNHHEEQVSSYKRLLQAKIRGAK
ncbi:hypothetical protein [Roseibium litorale]|uniref:Uncharacterized protein n=1 Tax=Roseibium litorale TaxID=2803841 RepID=A0ABR9CH43_9HYPH|nr:hypothetical protein [Roseibium litorale]MBD8890179.1 hypothetical protein [Roseibium litorale]